MCSGPWMDSEGLGVADAVDIVSTFYLNSASMDNSLRQVRDELEVIHDLGSSSRTTLHAKGQDTSEAPGKILLGQLMRRMALQTRIADPAHILIALQPLGQLDGILAMPLSTQTQRLDTKKQLLSSEGIQTSTQISLDLNASADNECDSAECVPELQAVVSFTGLVELRETLGILAPVELSAVDDDTTDCCSVATDPLGRGVHDDVCAVVDGTNEVSSSAEGVVYHYRYTGFMCDGNDLLKVGNVVFGVADALEVDGLCLGVDRFPEVLWAVAVYELGIYAQARKHDLELVVSASIAVLGQ